MTGSAAIPFFPSPRPSGTEHVPRRASLRARRISCANAGITNSQSKIAPRESMVFSSRRKGFALHWIGRQAARASSDTQPRCRLCQREADGRGRTEGNEKEEGCGTRGNNRCQGGRMRIDARGVRRLGGQGLGVDGQADLAADAVICRDGVAPRLHPETRRPHAIGRRRPVHEVSETVTQAAHGHDDGQRGQSENVRSADPVECGGLALCACGRLAPRSPVPASFPRLRRLKNVRNGAAAGQFRAELSGCVPHASTV
jgi:hypothetical protein